MANKNRTTEKQETPETTQKPDGVFMMEKDGQTIVAELFFNHNSRETFRDRLIRRILTDKND